MLYICKDVVFFKDLASSCINVTACQFGGYDLTTNHACSGGFTLQNKMATNMQCGNITEERLVAFLKV